MRLGLADLARLPVLLSVPDDAQLVQSLSLPPVVAPDAAPDAAPALPPELIAAPLPAVPAELAPLREELPIEEPPLEELRELPAEELPP